MPACVRCGAVTDLLMGNGAPLCYACHDELEREAKRSLIVLFEDAIRIYREDVSKLSVAAGSLEFDAFQKLLAQCCKSHQTCVELLGAYMSRVAVCCLLPFT